MTLKRLNHPTHLLTNNTQAVSFSDVVAEAKVILRENGVGLAEISLDNELSIYPNDVITHDLLTLSIGETTGSATPIFYGNVQFPKATIQENTNKVMLTCQHVGYGLCEMVVGNEYGSQSKNPTLDTLKKILTDSTYGILPAYVDKVLGSATDSGWDLFNSSYTSDHIANPTDVIKYVEFPLKPANKCLEDLCDLTTALKAGDAGVHWTVDNTGFFRLKVLGTSQTASVGSGAPDWTVWYGGTTNDNGQATITLGDDADLIDYEEQKEEATHILYYGNFRRPGNGDAWTETDVSDWGTDDANITLDSADDIFAVGSASVEATLNNASLNYFRYPASKDAHWDFTKMGDFTHVPTLNFSVYRAGMNVAYFLKLFTDATHNYILKQTSSLNLPLTEQDKWYNFEVPIGPHWRNKEYSLYWADHLADSLDWSDVNWIEFGINGSVGNRFFVDGLHFGNVPVCRIAKNTSFPFTRMKTIVDNIGKDDSLIASDDSGTMAQLAYAELLRSQKTVYTNIVKVPILPDALPGQQFSLNGATYRATEIMHEIKNSDYTTTLTLTSDLTNSYTRRRYEDLNKQYNNFLPKYQTRAATNISSGTIDYRVQRLEKDYAP